MNQSEIIRSQIRFILVRILNLEIDPEEIGNSDLLFGGNLGMDSMTTIQIITEIEDYFGIEIEDEEIGVALFESVNSLAQAVSRHLAEQAASIV